ncbi:hypothetical protein COLINT_03360 [Collinsella intestinalis DSM 13280]|uniref:Uncharacterized protein n=1 Tax=Collinsella intestinalis DSM 13280 TaxID=521003 RepID=C4FBA7_9ACTN|nr:hypothetical protein COLINT_03360 [Collinsella intestinalis DSM 13280]
MNGAAAREAMNDLPPRKGAYEPFVHKLLFCYTYLPAEIMHSKQVAGS